MKVAVLEVMEDDVRPSISQAVEYCKANGLFYKAFKKGDLVYMPFDSIAYLGIEISEETLPDIFCGNKRQSFSTNAFLFRDMLRCFIAHGKQMRKKCTLYDVLSKTAEYAFSSPRSYIIRYKESIDGEMLFSTFADEQLRKYL